MPRLRKTIAGRMLAVVLLGYCAAVLPPITADAESQVHTIVIDKMAFGPAPANLHAGDVVEWINRDIFLHTATAADHSFDVILRPGAKAHVTLRHSGTIAYTCRFHPNMKGQLQVAR